MILHNVVLLFGVCAIVVFSDERTRENNPTPAEFTPAPAQPPQHDTSDNNELSCNCTVLRIVNKDFKAGQSWLKKCWRTKDANARKLNETTQKLAACNTTLQNNNKCQSKLKGAQQVLLTEGEHYLECSKKLNNTFEALNTCTKHSQELEETKEAAVNCSKNLEHQKYIVRGLVDNTGEVERLKKVIQRILSLCGEACKTNNHSKEVKEAADKDKETARKNNTIGPTQVPESQEHSESGGGVPSTSPRKDAGTPKAANKQEENKKTNTPQSKPDDKQKDHSVEEPQKTGTQNYMIYALIAAFGMFVLITVLYCRKEIIQYFKKLREEEGGKAKPARKNYQRVKQDDQEEDVEESLNLRRRVDEFIY